MRDLSRSQLLRIVPAAVMVALDPARPVAAAAIWPKRAVKFVVPFPAGSANDVAARILGDALATRWAQPVTVENLPGAESTIGVGDFVAAHDDHALLYTVAGSVTVAPLMFDRLRYDADRDLVPIVATASVILAVAVTAGMPAHTLDDLVRLARGRPGEWAWASGPTLPHYLFAAFLARHKLAMNHVAYRDAAQPQSDLGEGRIQVLVTSLQASASPVQAGKARYLAVTNSQRAAALPDVPTAREAGYPELTLDGVSGLFGRSGLPAALREQVADDVDSVLAEPSLRARLAATGQVVLGGTPAGFEALIDAQRRWARGVAELVDLKSAR